ncbi:MAG: PQQ-dependent sugar dehydrogenase [Pirellulales bacterium]|nr:PQQ-dependent sugar dehydrogenase [Pirellulales bacterium]
MCSSSWVGRVGFAGCLVAVCAGSSRAAEAQVDTSPLPAVRVAPAFADVNWTGWDSGESSGQLTPLRPIVLTHAGDGTDRAFVATQQGVIHILPTSGSGPTEVFLDLTSQVSYDDKTNEEGLLGLVFHPKYADNGQFFVYFTNRRKPHQNVVARFHVDPNNPSRALPDSREPLLVLDKPFWNHDGGTLAFGPDGMLYIAVGDGGKANDPFENGQNLGTLLGKILRIDVDRQDEGRKYAIPADNPFVKRAKAKGEIWAYGLRNVWRHAFDRETGLLWAGDVGQDLWEEIDLIEKGGNYGWNRREATHPFGPNGAEARADMIEPLWEYSHDVGKSITGGLVYRGQGVPELRGAYLYADYVSLKLWALWYDPKTKKVTANRELTSPGVPVVSFGEDAAGEVYLLTISPTQGAIWRFMQQD